MHKQKHMRTRTYTVPSLTHFRPESEMGCFPTGAGTLFWYAYLLSRHCGI